MRPAEGGGTDLWKRRSLEAAARSKMRLEAKNDLYPLKFTNARSDKPKREKDR
jgi:hypothetical protein